VIEAIVSLDRAGCLASVSCTGHSVSYSGENNIVCIAFSTLMRTLTRLLSLQEGLLVKGEAPEEGVMFFVMTVRDERKREWARGVTDYFLRGISDLSSEYPRDIRVEITERE
jgi:uncharacterized protein YsxB (DUF464 family)